MPDHILENGDSPELEALFESIARQQENSAEPPSPAPGNSEESVKRSLTEMSSSEMYDKVGQLTRRMHDALRDLGYDKSFERVAEAIPDAKDRLGYIATLTENAAERVLNATDIAQPIQDKLASNAQALSERWSKLYSNQLSIAEFKQLADETRSYLEQVPSQTGATSTQLMDIVMAQDFQDLTGQVIKKMMGMVQIMESELVKFLVEYSPVEKKVDISPNLLNGPVVNPEGRTDVVTSQGQVDDLLASLGF